MAVKKISKNVYEIPKQGNMNVPGIVYVSEKLMEAIKKDKTLEQVKNVAMLPGIIKASIAMPDAHQGYGFCVGGIAAFDLDKGIISPGGVGYDINCGVRLLASNLTKKEFLKKRKEVTHQIVRDVPVGVGRGGKIKLTDKELDEIMRKGVKWAVDKGYGSEEDIERIEDSGCIKGANPEKVSQRAKTRGRDQLGTLGAGNHFIDIQEVDKIYDEKIGKIFGLEKEGQIVVMIHTGSRGLGHQIASDYIRIIEKEHSDIVKSLPDRELACAPIGSKLGKDYMAAMAAAANFAFTNRHIIMHKVREAFRRFFPKAKLNLVYDIAHNIAKFESYNVNGKNKEVCVHRKGATRSLGAGRKEIPPIYRKVGCPVFIPGSMGTFSYVLVGTKKAEEISFGSTAHGSGRVMSRTEAKKTFSPEQVKKMLEERDIYIEAQSVKGMLEENPNVYKSSDEVVKVSHELGIGNLVARLKPLAVIIG
jgi:tRNA-splicing ligase RtcB